MAPARLLPLAMADAGETLASSGSCRGLPRGLIGRHRGDRAVRCSTGISEMVGINGLGTKKMTCASAVEELVPVLPDGRRSGVPGSQEG
jgi:hypothetical protein